MHSKIHCPIKVQFRDVDSLGHVNNAVYLSYLECARVEFCDRLFGPQGFDRFPFILAEVTIRFLSPAFMGDVLDVVIGVSEIGRKSFIFKYVVQAQSDERVIAEAQSVQVMYDYREKRTVEITEEWRNTVFSNSAVDTP